MKTATIVLLLCLALPGFARPLPDKSEKELQTRDPARVADILRGGSDEQRNQLAKELHIMAPDDSNLALKSGAPCTRFETVEERRVNLRPDAENVVLLADSNDCDSSYIIVFDRGRKSEWRHLQTLRLPAQNSPPEISFSELIRPGVSEVLVHGEHTREGGSAQQTNFVILKLLHDRMETVLDTVESLDLVLPDRPENDADNLTQTQRSTFTLQKAAPTSGAAMGILEKEVFKEKKTTLTRYRYWSWDGELERFRSAPRDGGDLVEWQPPKKPAGKAPATPATTTTPPVGTTSPADAKKPTAETPPVAPPKD